MIGKIINSIEIVELVGKDPEGAFGTVYKALDNTSNNQVAVKMLKKGLDPTEEDRFKRENAILHHLAPHDNIIKPLSDILSFNDHIYYLLELADDNLERHLKTYTTSNKALIQIFRQICVGLKHAHANNIAHRDLHEKNILIKRERDANIAKLSDFGRAKDFSMAAITTNPCLWGALSITSPEVIAQVTNKDSTPDRQFIADIFSLGVILHSVFNPSSSFYITKIIELYETAQRNGVFSNHATIDTRNNFYDYCIGYFRYNNLNDYLMVKACLDEDALKQLNQLISEMINPDYRLRASNLDEILAKCDSIDVLLGNR